MKILNRLPVAEKHYRLDCHGQNLEIKPYQIVLQVNISDDETWDARTPIFPALLDTGNHHAFSIQQQHLRRWAGIDPRFLRLQGKVRVGQRSATLHRARIWIHRNHAGKRDLRGDKPFLLAVDEGIIAYPEDESNYPRLPLVGLRAILGSNLRLIIDGKRKHASLRSPLW
jgi:hypothetical protein